MINIPRRFGILLAVSGSLIALLPWFASNGFSQNFQSVVTLSDVAAKGGILSSFTVGKGNASIHIFPVIGVANIKIALLKTAGPTPLTYHNGPVMKTVNIYTIFWAPPKLQTGAATTLSNGYQALQSRLMKDYPGHGIHNNNTQYYEKNGGTISYIQNSGAFGGTYVDTSPYPSSACQNSNTPGNCITDAQIKSEVQRVMTARNWQGGLDKIFIVYTSSGEGSCYDADSANCSYSQYCAYHGFISGSPDIIYAHVPFADPKLCQQGNPSSPNGDPAADTAASAASHELTEAITDPLLSGWFTDQATAGEIGDLCAYQYGTNSWGGNANQMWNGNPYLLQQEYDNHVNGCVDLGP